MNLKYGKKERRTEMSLFTHLFTNRWVNRLPEEKGCSVMIHEKNTNTCKCENLVADA